MSKKMLIDATHPEETRVVVVDGNKVEDFDFESVNKRQLAGNIYLAKVTRVEPSLQAAFVEYGGNRHGFLAFAEIHPDYYQIPVADREALLAEEAREEEAERDREEARDNGGQSRRSARGRRSRGEPKARRGSTASGLEVIDMDEPEADRHDPRHDVPAGLEVAGHDRSDEVAIAGPAEGALASIEPTGGADTLDTEPEAVSEPPHEARAGGEPEPEETVAAGEASGPKEPDTETAATEDDETDGADEAADDETGNDETPPRSMAESAGLDDTDRVTEEVAESAPENDAEDRTGADSPDEALATHEDVQAADEPDPAREAHEESPAADTPDEMHGDAQAADAAAEAAPASEETDTTADADDSADASGETGREGGRQRRRRRRGRDEKPASGKSAADAPATESAAPANGAENGNGSNGANGEGEDVEQPEQIGAEDTLEEAARARSRLRRRYKIQDVVKVRQIMLVQVVKEERGNKGAALTTYLSLAGRYCVLMPNTARGGGISRKITNAGDRKRLREIAGELEVPRGMGLIVRTAGAERTRAEIKRDYEFLLRQWEQIRDLTLKSIAPTLIYEEGSLIKRSIRDLYSKEIDQILVEGEAGYREAKEYMKMLMPSHAKNVQPYAEPIPLFSRYQVETYLNGMFNPTVQLKSGGYIVIGVTEALVAIDVNSGRATKQGSIEETALQTNLEAAEEISRQLRLRDLAGLIVIDFIDMDENRNNRAVEKRMKDRLKTDRARIQMGRISAFGLMEMSRQRLRPGMLEATTKPCQHCHGSGLIRSDESLALAILREVEEHALRGRSDEIAVNAPVDVANYLINAKRRHIAQIEARNAVTVMIVADPAMVSPDYKLERSKSQGKRPAPAARDVVSAASVGIEAVAVEEAADEAAGRDDERGGTRGAERGGGHGGDEDGRGRRRRGRRGGRRRHGDGDEGREDREPQEAGADEAGAEKGGAEKAGTAEDDRPRSRRRRGGRRRGGRGREDGHHAEEGRGEAGESAGARADGEAREEPAAPSAPVGEKATAGTAEETAGVEPNAVPAQQEAPAPAAAAAKKPDELQAGDGSTAAAEQDREPEPVAAAGGQSGNGPVEAAPEPEAPDEPERPEAPEELQAGDGSTAAAEQDRQREPAEQPAARESDDDTARPKKRGWWSLGR